MKDKVSELIKIIGNGYTELIFDFTIDSIEFNSIELDINDDILLHIIIDDQDGYFNFEEIDIDKQIKVYKLLLSFI